MTAGSRRPSRDVSALIVLLVVGLSACRSADPLTSPAAASNAPVTSGPTASVAGPAASPLTLPVESMPPPDSAASPDPAGLRRDAFARVVTEGLRVRTEPLVGDASRKLEPLLWNGAILFVIDGPVAASGYDWYLVEPMTEVDVQVHPDPPPPGWVAVGSSDGVPWLAPDAVECYDTPLGWLAFDLLEAPIGLSGLSCFGDRTLRFTAGLGVESGGGCTETTGPWSIDPAWLGPCPDPAYRLADPEGGLTDDPHALPITLAPSVDVRSLPDLEPGKWLLVDIVGQYAHPAAGSCKALPTAGDGEGPPRPEVVALRCREKFVVTSLSAHVDT